MGKTPLLTAEWLERHRACPSQVDRFRKIWPEGCRVTVRNLRKALNLELDVYSVRDLFTDQVLAEYEKVTAQAWVHYKKFRDPTLVGHEKITGPALVEALRQTLRDAP